MFVSFRRKYLDEMLSSETFSGDVLDVGGKRANPRGSFRPPLEKTKSWKFLSIDPQTEPDFLASAEQIPTEANSFDQVVMCEVAEHLQNPSRVLNECARVLKPGGKLVMSMPFLYGVHADPHDFQRWTHQKIRQELSTAGFREAQITPMGGFFAVVCDLHEMVCYLEFEKKGKLPLFWKATRVLIRKVLLPLLFKFDHAFGHKDLITTGYFVRAVKK